MNLYAVGLLVAERRRSRDLTLQALAKEAHVGRSTLAALEGGKLKDLGYTRVSRICNAVGLTLEARPLMLEKPLARHRHLTDTAARELTKAAIEDIVLRGDIDSWRGLVRAIHSDGVTASRDARARFWPVRTAQIHAFAPFLCSFQKC